PGMLRDLDELMRNRAIDTLIVPMHEAMHSSFRRLSRGAKVTRGYAVKRVDRNPLLVTYPMEREEAAATGLEVRLASEFDHDRIFQSATNVSAAYAEFFDILLRELGAGDAIAFFGNVPVQLYHGIIESLDARGRPVHRSNGEDTIRAAPTRKERGQTQPLGPLGPRTHQS